MKPAAQQRMAGLLARPTSDTQESRDPGLETAPGEAAVIPRGVKFAVALPDTTARGYLCENYGTPLSLPDLGPIGSNGLAYPRHFLYPVAAYEDKSGDFELLVKFDGALWQAKIDHSPLSELQ